MSYAILTFISLVLFAAMVVCFLLSQDDLIDNDMEKEDKKQ